MIALHAPTPCPRCQGDGWLPVVVGSTWAGRAPLDNPLPREEKQTCERCEGSGDEPATWPESAEAWAQTLSTAEGRIGGAVIVLRDDTHISRDALRRLLEDVQASLRGVRREIRDAEEDWE